MKVVDLFSCVSSGATVLAAVVAIYALSSWRSQFKYQRKYECILDLRSQLHGANEAAFYLSSLREQLSESIRTGVDNDLFEPGNFPHELQRAWWDHLSKLQRTWALLEVTLGKSEMKLFTVDPYKLQAEMTSYVNEMINLSCGEPRGSLFQLHKLVSNSIVAVEKQYNLLEQKCRLALTKIK